MPRPKGSFKTPEQLEAMSPEQKQRYIRNHTSYVRHKDRRKRIAEQKDAAARADGSNFTSWRVRKQRESDAKEISYDGFPESFFREWLRTHCPTQGKCRLQADRWEITNSDIARFLMGKRPLKPETLQSISIDTSITIEKLLLQYAEAQIAAINKNMKKDDTSSD